MAYIDQTGMTERFGESEMLALTDRTKSGTIDTDVLARAITAAEANINTYLFGHYDVPFADGSVPDLIVDLTADIARYRLMDNRSTKEAEARYNDAVAMLRDLSTGKAVLPITATQETVSGGFVSNKNRSDRIFTCDTLRDF